MSYILLKKFFQAKVGKTDRKFSLHMMDDNLATQIAQELNKELEAMKSKTKTAPVFKVNKRGQFMAQLPFEYTQYFSEDFLVLCFTVLLKFGFKLDKQYDEPPQAAGFKEVFVFLRM